MKYCKFCRKELADNEMCTCQESVACLKKVNKNKNKLLILGIGIVLTIILIIIFFALKPTKPLIDPFEFTKVSFKGYNGNGTAAVEFNEEELLYLIVGEEPDDFEETIEWSEKYGMYSEDIEYKYTPSDNLSNGDIVNVSFVISGDAKSKIVSTERDFIVEGLKEIEKVDVFKDVSISFKGVSGKAQLEITYNSNDEFINACNISCDNEFGLSNGDKIILEITNSDNLALTHGKIPLSLSKKYEVSGLDAYVTKVDQIPKELIEEYAEKFMKEEQEENESDKDGAFSYSTVKYYSTYFMIPKEEAFLAAENELHVVVYYDEYYNDEFFRTDYVPLVFKNILVNSDGSLAFEYEDGVNATFSTDIKLHLDDLEKNYTVEEIKELNVEALSEKPVETKPENITTTSPTTTQTPSAPVVTTPVTQAPTTTPSTPKPVVKQRADIKTGISWDGVSPIIYTYPDGTTGTEIRAGAKYEAYPGRYVAVAEFQVPGYVPPTVSNNTCSHCQKTKGDGTNGTCVRWLLSAVNCPNCGVLVNVHTCHTCGN